LEIEAKDGSRDYRMAIAEALRTFATLRAPVRRLTAREQEILALSATGYDSETVADMLQLTPEVIREELSSIIQRVGARSKMEAVLIVVRRGLMDHPTPITPILRSGR